MKVEKRIMFIEGIFLKPKGKKREEMVIRNI